MVPCAPDPGEGQQSDTSPEVAVDPIARHYLPDSCPLCFHVSAPLEWFAATDSVRAEYRCEECDHQWWTSYGRRDWLAGLPCAPHPAA